MTFLRKDFSVAATAALCAVLLASCASNRWNVSHPHYDQAPAAADSIAVLGATESFVVTRDKWFANHLDIDRDSLYPFMNRIIQPTLLKTLSGTFRSLYVLPDSLFLKFPEESEKVDEHVYFKGRFPVQGRPFRDGNGYAPPYILLIHEFILGLDQHRENYYDYTQTQKEAPETRTANNLTVIMAYTLWDNARQIPLYSSLLEENFPLDHGFSAQELTQITETTARTMIQQIRRGAAK
ncbi:MAG: hypothetical protein WCS54_06020 [Fibrobacteraceae bacterium]